MEKYVGLKETVHEYLMEMILSQQIKPGERISEEKIAKTLGCSRAPIREALTRLSNEGIILIYPRRFAQVADYTDETIKQVGVSRVFIDLAATKLSILYGNNIAFMRMQTLADQCFQASKENDVAMRIRKDCEFHLELSRISQNQQLTKFAEELYLRIEFIQASKYTDLLRPEEQFEEHSQIVSDLLKRNEKEVLNLLTLHNCRFHHLNDTYPKEFFEISF